MTHLALSSCEKVTTKLDKFERFLQAYDLKILFRQENRTNGTIDLTINAYCFEQAKWLSGIAFDFFENEFLSMRTEFKTMSVKRAA